MAEIGYQLFFTDSAAEQMEFIDDELEFLTTKGCSFLLFWLREKAHRAKVKINGSTADVPMYKGAELADNLVGALRDDIFGMFNESYMDYLYRQMKFSNFDEESKAALDEYLNEKRTLAEISILTEHLEDNEIINLITRLLREEPKNEWYEDLIHTCEESVCLRQYYALLFGVDTNEVFPVSGEFKPEPGSVVYMAIGDGAKPEACMFLKRLFDRKKGYDVSVFCRINQHDELEYFTVSDKEASCIPISKYAENDSNMERLTLWLKEAIDFSDDVYLEKPTVTDLANEFELSHPNEVNQFNRRIDKIEEKFQGAKKWVFGKGKEGEKIAQAPAFAKLKATRILAMHFESVGDYAIPLGKLVELMQTEVKEQQEFTDAVFNAMRAFSIEDEKNEKNQIKDNSREIENTNLKDQNVKQATPAER